MSKRCSACKQDKGLEDFYKCSSKPDGLQTSCKDCHRAKSKTAAAKLNTRKSKLKTQYGLDYKDYLERVEAQANCCLLCLKQTPTLCVDHNHSNGQVRGLICSPCNKGLGMFREDLDTMERAYNYLKVYQHG